MTKKRCQPCDREYTRDDARTALKRNGLEDSDIDVDLVVEGMNEEREHGDVTCCDPDLSFKIAAKHLSERIDYYARLKQAMEDEDG